MRLNGTLVSVDAPSKYLTPPLGIWEWDPSAVTLRRMHLVRRALLRTDPSKANVTRTVTDHGFWELGRLSVAYRTLFGESPSE